MKTSSFVVILACGAALAAPAAAQTPVAARLDSIARTALSEMKIPGMSVAVIKGRDTLLFRGYGYADLENDVAATPHTVYRIGSVTKQFTAAAILRLAEQGKLSVDDTVQKFFPGYDTKGNRVTVHHLLNHTSGIRSYTSIGPRWERTTRLEIQHDSMIALFSSEPFDFKPGLDWRYNNSGYYLLGVIIERLSGKQYGDYLQEEFFTPLGLTSTQYCDMTRLVKGRADGYQPKPEGGWINAEPMSMSHPFAAGALCSTVGDLAAWTRVLMAGRVVNAPSLTRMLTPGKLSNGDAHTYGYGLFVTQLDDRREISHGGGINGFVSALAYYPADTLTVAILTNTGAANVTRLQRRMARAALGMPDFKPKDLPLTAAELARFAGSYQDGENAIQVSSEGGKLFWKQPSWTKPERLRSEGGGVFIPESDEDVRITFLPGNARAQRLVIMYMGQKFGEATRQ
ncbi:MAG TPA: serine hydrolase domain-containing protein [Longimicrobiales bacterium]